MIETFEGLGYRADPSNNLYLESLWLPLLSRFLWAQILTFR